MLSFTASCLRYGVSKRLPHQKIIGETIRKFRKELGLSQEVLAEKADLHPVYLGQVERGEQSASVHALVRVSKALKISLSDLVRGI